MPFLSWGRINFQRPKLNGPEKKSPKGWTFHIFFGDTRVLVEAVGEEKPLIEIILQIGQNTT